MIIVFADPVERLYGAEAGGRGTLNESEKMGYPRAPTDQPDAVISRLQYTPIWYWYTISFACVSYGPRLSNVSKSNSGTLSSRPHGRFVCVRIPAQEGAERREVPGRIDRLSYSCTGWRDLRPAGMRWGKT